jgi:hypothetical protein
MLSRSYLLIGLCVPFFSNACPKAFFADSQRPTSPLWAQDCATKVSPAIRLRCQVTPPSPGLATSTTPIITVSPSNSEEFLRAVYLMYNPNHPIPTTAVIAISCSNSEEFLRAEYLKHRANQAKALEEFLRAVYLMYNANQPKATEAK